MSLVVRLVKAELLKVRTTRTTWGLLLGMALLVAIFVVVVLASSDAKEIDGGNVRDVLSLGGGLGYLFALSAGIVGMAGEYRHGTIGHTMLSAPQRWPVLVSKLIAYALVGLVFGLVAVLVTYGIALPVASSKDAAFSLSDTLPERILVGTLLACMLFGAIGVGLGAILTDQVLALGVAIGWTLVVELILYSAIPSVAQYLPGGVLAALVRSRTEDILSLGAGAAMALLYVAIAAGVGAYLTSKRDLT